ncbi:MAG: hypothetical protein ACYC2Y_07595 [Armatimonadota bacterium]
MKIVCGKCGAVYEKLPAYTCPRCGELLCGGCEKCAKRAGSANTACSKSVKR